MMIDRKRKLSKIVIVEGGEKMTNWAAMGYAIIALQNLGYTYEQIDAVWHEMYAVMDVTHEKEAEWAYEEF